MPPVVIDLIAADPRTRLLAEAEVRRRQQARATRLRHAPAWRSRPARLLVTLARRLDPGVDARPATAR